MVAADWSVGSHGWWPMAERSDDPAQITLVPYDPRWVQRFEVERARIVAALGERAHAVHHIGSTSVPGLAAKDRVDLCVEVDDPDAEQAYLPDLLAAGYRLPVVEPGHRCLTRADPEEPPTNVHVYRVGAPEVAAYLAFRDRLRADPADRQRYEAVKRELAQHGWRCVDDYADAKGPTIREILARAGVR